MAEAAGKKGMSLSIFFVARNLDVEHTLATAAIVQRALCCWDRKCERDVRRS